MPNAPKITILLATYNGERYLAEQLNSINQQSYTDFKIIASDDGSTDNTRDMLSAHSIETLTGPKKGFAANFIHLIKQSDEHSDYYAFSDQDDVWEANKLERAIDWIDTIDSNKPALYCARTCLVDEKLEPLGCSPLFQKSPAFLNALVQNIGGGNTMVFNRAACNLLRQTPQQHQLFAHDWWAYLLITGAGGAVFYDSKPSLKYRQHQANLLGNNMSLRARYDRVRMLFQGNLKAWLDQNNQNLLAISHVLTDKNRRQLEAFERARKRRLLPRVISILKLGVHRQTRMTHIGLLVGAIFNKL